MHLHVNWQDFYSFFIRMSRCSVGVWRSRLVVVCCLFVFAWLLQKVTGRDRAASRVDSIRLISRAPCDAMRCCDERTRWSRGRSVAGTRLALSAHSRPSRCPVRSLVCAAQRRAAETAEPSDLSPSPLQSDSIRIAPHQPHTIAANRTSLHRALVPIRRHVRASAEQRVAHGAAQPDAQREPRGSGSSHCHAGCSSDTR